MQRDRNTTSNPLSPIYFPQENSLHNNHRWSRFPPFASISSSWYTPRMSPPLNLLWKRTLGADTHQFNWKGRIKSRWLRPKAQFRIPLRPETWMDNRGSRIQSRANRDIENRGTWVGLATGQNRRSSPLRTISPVDHCRRIKCNVRWISTDEIPNQHSHTGLNALLIMSYPFLGGIGFMALCRVLYRVIWSRPKIASVRQPARFESAGINMGKRKPKRERDMVW